MTVEAFQEFIDPKLIWLPIALYLIGMALKKAEKVQDKNIPLWLGAIGIALAGLWVFSTTVGMVTAQNVAGAILAAIAQGVLCAGAAVLANNVYKQNSSKG